MKPSETIESRAISDSLVSAITSGARHSEPFVHVLLSLCFPREVYESMIANFPRNEYLTPLRHSDAMVNGRLTRLQLDLGQEAWEKLPEPAGKFWRIVHAGVIARDVRDALFSVHKGILEERHGLAFHKMRMEIRATLICDLAGYRIGIHPDIPSKVITTQFYLPVDGSRSHIGTRFYRVDGKGFAFDRQVQFLPNSGYSFPVTDSSFHGVSPLDAVDSPRYSIMLIYYAIRKASL